MDTGPKNHFEGSHYHAHHAEGPFSFLHPTHRYLSLSKSDAKPAAAPAPGPTTDSTDDAASGQENDQQPPEEDYHHHIYHIWRSRDNRKGRHAIALSPEFFEKIGVAGPKPTNSMKEALAGMWRMVTQYPVWDVSYDVATIFTLGSVVWVINGFFEWLPLQSPSTEFDGEVAYGGGATALIGATIFEIGSVLLMLEAVNENRTDCFGWALEAAWESRETLLTPAKDGCNHHHRNKGAWLRRSSSQEQPLAKSGSDTGVESSSTPPRSSSPQQGGGDASGGGGDTTSSGADDSKPKRTWSWWPSWYELKTHYFREIGFLACLSQMIGASVFWISALTGLPQIQNLLSVPAANGIFWLPQVIGGTGFIVSSFLFMLECQSNWYTPAAKLLGWHIGFWNLVGAIGFTLCGALGFAINAPNMPYASTLSTFIGSWAFLIGSVIQWYESLDKFPVSVQKDLSRVPKGPPA